MIKPLFSKDDVKRALERRVAVIGEQIIERLQYLGEKAVVVARDQPELIGYTDRTGNLRSSVGYAIYVDGEIVKQSFKGDKQEGRIEGMGVANDIGESTTGYVLVVVAGMEYATYVEATGRDVLTSAEMYAKQNIGRILKALQR